LERETERRGGRGGGEEGRREGERIPNKLGGDRLTWVGPGVNTVCHGNGWGRGERESWGMRTKMTPVGELRGRSQENYQQRESRVRC